MSKKNQVGILDVSAQFISGAVRVFACWLALLAGLQAQQYVFRAYRQAEGLKNIAINGSATDRDGFLWVATENGVYRFLGSSFERYGPEQGLTGLDARDIVPDPNGTVWVGTEENLFRWDGVKFLPAGPQPIPIVDRQGMALEDARHLLVVVDKKLYRVEHDVLGRFVSFIPAIPEGFVASDPDLGRISSVSVLSESLNGRIWIGCGKKLCSLSSDPIDTARQGGQSLVTKWGKDKGLAEDTWRSVVLDHAGTLWAAGMKHVMVMPRGTRRFVDRSIPGREQQNIFGHAPMLEDPQGRMLAAAGSGLARWEGNGWRIIGRGNGLARSNGIMGMAFDSARDLALASRGDGLYEWPGYGDWEAWGDQQNLPSASIWTINFSGPDRVLVGTDQGLALINPRKGSSGPLLTHPKWAFGHVSAVGANRDGSLWVAAHSGAVLRVEAKTGIMEETAKLPVVILAGFEDAGGRLFLFSDQGLYMREAGAARAAPHPIPAANSLLGNSTITQAGCSSPDGADWFVGNNRIVRFKNGQWSTPPIDGLPTLRGSLLGASCANDGSIWVTGDQTGTWRLTQGQDRMQASQLQVPAEFRSLTSLTILADSRGWVWLGTDMGMVVWDGHTWRHLSQESGLIWNDTNQGVLSEAADGSMWIGTSGGVSHLLHPEQVFDSVPLTASLTEFRRGPVDFTGAQQISIPAGGPPLRFRISSPVVRNRSELTLKLRMVRMQSDWMDTEDGNAAFARIDPGAYTFMAMACNPGFNACSAPVNVQVRILPPWWNTYWFYAFGSLVALLLLLALLHLYSRHLREKSRRLEALVGERTRELQLSREQLRIQATHDGLTGMLNRAAILQILDEEIERVRRTGTTMVVAIADLDHFKRVNDSLGHLAGDEALRQFASEVGAAIRPYDHAGRYGGEEFLLLLSDIPPDALEERLTSLHSSISNLQVRIGESEVRVDCSVGAAVFGPSAEPANAESLLVLSDQALYEAKSLGRNRVVIQWMQSGLENGKDLHLQSA